MSLGDIDSVKWGAPMQVFTKKVNNQPKSTMLTKNLKKQYNKSSNFCSAIGLFYINH